MFEYYLLKTRQADYERGVRHHLLVMEFQRANAKATPLFRLIRAVRSMITLHHRFTRWTQQRQPVVES
jgi:hypothetical protein